MKRLGLDYLIKWVKNTSRKPLVIRGARQVGKSYLVRDFCRVQNLACLEINFEKNPAHKQIFESRDIKKVRNLLELHFERSLQTSDGRLPCLLFLDEIQVAPEVFSLLRYFYEDWPELPVIAAGSLLDFALKEIEYPVPVGRIEYFFLGPMNFEEFLIAQGKEKLHSFLEGYEFPSPIPEFIHTQLLEQVRLFSFLGGMPEVIGTFVRTQDFHACDQVLKSLLLTYQDDFNKYRNRVSFDRLHLLFNSIPREVGRKLVYSRLAPSERSDAMAKALDLLCLAKIVQKVHHSSGNGVPLGAEVDLKKFKVIFIDVGLMSSVLGIQLTDFKDDLDLIRIHEGSVAEQFVGQQLLYMHPFYMNPELYYWSREKAGSMAEVDYLISLGSKVIPVEVKAGKSGKFKSLRIFMNEKGTECGIRFSVQQPEKEEGLLHLPLYLVNQTQRILNKLS